jgi:5-methylthioadenosine/S-adenosylhomocysteine deaminase
MQIVQQQLISAAMILPVQPANTVLHGYALLIEGDKIADLLPTNDALAKYPAVSHLALDDHILLPGLVNAHAHSAMTLMRGLADDLPLMRWLAEHIWPAEGRHVSAQFVRDGVSLAVAEQLRGGVTCMNDMYFFAEETADICTQMGMRAVLGMIVIEFPSAYARSADEYLAKGLALHDRLRGSKLLTACLAPHAPYTVSDATFLKIATYADQLDLRVHMHVHETAQEMVDSKREHGVRPIQRLQKLGLWNERLNAVHMTQLSADEIDSAGANGVNILHCPESNMKLASGIAPIAALQSSGVNVALGTDGCASNNDLDLFGEMRSAALLAKVATGDASAFNAQSAVYAATMGGARALGLDHLIGSIEIGKCADLCALRIDELDALPLYQAHSYIVYSASRRDISHVWVNGVARLAHGILLDVDYASLRASAKEWQQRIKG